LENTLEGITMFSIDLPSVERINGYLIGRLVKDGYLKGWAWVKDGRFYTGTEYPICNGFGY
jgi:hypothetical protein